MDILLDSAKREFYDATAGCVITMQQAKEAYEKGLVTDSNVSFARLASFGFDFDELDAYYKEIDG